MKKFDVIADVHGRFDKLESLLLKMGYRPQGDGFRAPEGHQAVFLGDLIDPKPGHPSPGGVRKVLKAAKAMQEAGDALVIMGNHEFNAICFHSYDPDGKPLRTHDEKNHKTHQGTLDDFPEWEDPASEWLSLWLPWMKRLPMWLDLGGLRVIHACWHSDHFEPLDGRSLEDDGFLLACATKGEKEYLAVEALLKGIEVPLPEPHFFIDHTGTPRRQFRARWWHVPGDGVSCRDLVFPESEAIVELPVDADSRELFSPYPADAPLVFFGHYFKPASQALAPECHNVACLDHSAAIGGPLVAYRWNGEASIKLENYISHS